METQEMAAKGVAVGPDEGPRELQGIGRAERMKAQQANGLVADVLRRNHFRPSPRQAIEDMAGVFETGRFKDTLSSQADEGRAALHGGPPPYRDALVLAGQPSHQRRGRIVEAQRDQPRGIPKPHRPSFRSSNRAFKARPSGSFGRGSFQKP